jgi:TBC1 domain family protein 5
MLDILFIFSKLNPDLGYRQGMHELLAPTLWIVEHDAIDQNSLVGTTSGENDDSLMLQMLDANYIEHDAFTIFCIIMQTARSFYEHSDMKSSAGQQGSSPIISRSQHIHQVVLRTVDPELAEHLQAIEVLPQIFLT